jgi:putative drug exporter of the RND superfamily
MLMTHLTRWCFRRRYLVVGLWVTGLVLLVLAGKAAGKDYSQGFSVPGTDSTRAQQLLAGVPRGPGSGDDTIVIHTNGVTVVTDPAVRQRVSQAFTAIAGQPLTANLDSPYLSTAGRQVSADQHTAYAIVSFTKQDQDLTKADITPLVDTASTLRGPDLQVEFGGGAFQTLKGSPLSGSVAIGLAAAAIVLLLAFGSPLATVIPLLAAVFAVGAGVEIVGLLSHVLSINAFTPSVAALIGIGVAVDYALFVVTRHRSGLRSGLSPEQAAVTALATSGRAIVFAGATVVIAMLGLLLLDVDFLTGVGLAAAITVAFSVAVATTLLPAFFGLLGMRVLSRRQRRHLAVDEGKHPAGQGSWVRWAAFVQRKPATLSLGALAIMIVLLLPSFAIHLGSSDQGNDPASSTTRRAYDLLAEGFGAGFNGPLLVVGETPDAATRAAFGRLTQSVRTTPGVASVSSTAPSPATSNGAPAVSILDVVAATSPQSERTQDLITRLRTTVIPQAERGTALRIYVGGQTAVFEDFASVLSHKLPLFLVVVVLFGFLLLLIAFRSVVIPLTAAGMNLLAAGAAFGVVVAVFQWGWGSDAIGLGRPGPIESFLPVMLIAILFGLSMDYQVFLVSRIHEEWLRTRDTSEAVRAGQASTGRVITAAAAIMVFVFLAFVLEGRRPIGEFGLGLAVAILLDALLLRTILVPAVMHLLGDRNWWLPAWLDRLLPNFSVDAVEPNPRAAAVVSAAL